MSVGFFAENVWPHLSAVCVCAGSRNSALLRFIAKQSKKDKKKVYTFYDERSAAFFALGLSKNNSSQGIKVAIVTTSGTAVAELLPAFIEAHYDRIPLLAVTADRPRRFRGTGAPQCIDQTELLSSHLDLFLDLATSDSLDSQAQNADKFLKACAQNSRVHLNLCFEDHELVEWDAAKTVSGFQKTYSPEAVSSCVFTDIEESFFKNLEKLSRPLVVLGPRAIPSDLKSQYNLFEFLEKLACPILVETQSVPLPLKIQKLQIVAGERSAKKLPFQSILRLGGVPTLRLWRDLETDVYKNISVLSLDAKPFSGLSNGRSLHFELHQNDEFWKQAQILPTWSKAFWEKNVLSEFFAADQKRALKVEKLFKDFPQSEPALVRSLSKIEVSHLYLGNSMPIRQWDLFSNVPDSKLPEVESHRGANGIDGQLSGFLGWVEAQKKGKRALGVWGDLTALYDLGAPWVMSQMAKKSNLIFCVVNNSGGQIFSRIKSLKDLNTKSRDWLWTLNHKVTFKSWAEMWSMKYVKAKSATDIHKFSVSKQKGPLVLELLPSKKQSDMFWKKYEGIF